MRLSFFASNSTRSHVVEWFWQVSVGSSWRALVWWTYTQCEVQNSRCFYCARTTSSGRWANYPDLSACCIFSLSHGNTPAHGTCLLCGGTLNRFLGLLLVVLKCDISSWSYMVSRSEWLLTWIVLFDTDPNTCRLYVSYLHRPFQEKRACHCRCTKTWYSSIYREGKHWCISASEDIGRLDWLGYLHAPTNWT